MNTYDFILSTRRDIVYTDGSCLGNPGPGGWGWLQVDSDKRNSGSCEKTTNNAMELTACIEALNSLNSSNLTIRTDSNYVKRGITEWVSGWKKRGWLTANKQPVKNKELWVQLETLNELYKPIWQWVKAHDKDEWNNAVDKLARERATSLLKD